VPEQFTPSSRDSVLGGVHDDRSSESGAGAGPARPRLGPAGPREAAAARGDEDEEHSRIMARLDALEAEEAAAELGETAGDGAAAVCAPDLTRQAPRPAGG
jgi:hypothetical protein